MFMFVKKIPAQKKNDIYIFIMSNKPFYFRNNLIWNSENKKRWPLANLDRK